MGLNGPSSASKDITSLHDIIAVVEQVTSKMQDNWFRGHSNSSYKLIPTVFRRSGTKKNSPYYDEAELLKEFVRRHPQSKHEHSNTLELLTYAQHYGLPTRLLDWTENLLVATYFACNENPKKDGSIHILNNPKSTRNEFDWLADDFGEELTKLCISGIPDLARVLIDLLQNSEKVFDLDSLMINGIPATSFKRASEIMRIIRKDKTLHIYHGNGEDEDEDEEDIISYSNSVLNYYPPMINKRLISQKGCFTVHSGKIFAGKTVIPCTPLEDNFVYDIGKIIIPSKYKADILKTLQVCGIDKSSLFPELEYQTQSIKERCMYN